MQDIHFVVERISPAPVGREWVSLILTLLVTRNTRDFPLDDPFVRIPYQV